MISDVWSPTRCGRLYKLELSFEIGACSLMLWIVKDFMRRPRLDDFAEIHVNHIIRDAVGLDTTRTLTCGNSLGTVPGGCKQKE